MAKPEMQPSQAQSKSQETQRQGQEPAAGSQDQPLARRSGFFFAPLDVFRLTPFSLMRRMAEEMDRAFGEPGQGRREEEIAWLPNVEVAERDGNLDIKAELPGISPENVRLEVTDDAVVLQGERKVERQEDKGDVHLSERRYGRFYRRIPLPEGAKVEEAKATFDNGVLEVTVPVQRERQEPRQIPIQSGSSQQTEKAA